MNPGAGTGILIARRKVLGGVGATWLRAEGGEPGRSGDPLLLQMGVPPTSLALCASLVKESFGAEALL